MSKSISLSASTRVSRRAKDGEAGVGISKADVLFCVSTSSTTTPADFAAWKSTVSEIGSMTLSSYLWTCTKITYTNSTTALIGKYCLGACKDMATVTEQYALSTSNTTAPTEWAETYTATKGYYLWTRNKLTMQNGNLRYTDAICVGYLGKDGTNGTSFTVRGKAYAHYATYAAWKTATGGTMTPATSPVLLDKNENTAITTPVIIYLSSSGSINTSQAATGDAYTIGTEEWVSNGSKWVDVGNIQGPSGEDGEDALRVEFSPDTLNFVYTYENNGNVVTVDVEESNKTVIFAVYKGSKDVTANCTFAISADDGGHIADTSKIVVDASTKQISVSSDCLKTKTLEDSSLTIAYPQAYFYVKITYNGETMTSVVNITVDSSACIGGIVWDNKQFKSEYDTFKTSSEGNITACMTAISQTATEIESKVSQTTYNSDLSKINTQFSDIIQTADKISSRVTDCETNIDGTKSELSSQITQTATSIRQELTDGLAEKASVELALQKDANGNLASVFNVKSNYMTFDTDNFKLTKDGTLTATNGKFSGSLDAVDGSFKSLQCTDGNGNSVGTLKFGSDGTLTFDGDWYSQGTKDGRSLRYYASDIWCRGAFGHYERITAVVKDTKMYVYTKGVDKDPVEVALESAQTTSGKTFYKIPLYNKLSDAAGCPIDIVVINSTADYYYQFTSHGSGKQWTVINGNNNQTVHFADIAGWNEMQGGNVVECHYVAPKLLNNASTSTIGAGVFWTGKQNFDW